MDYNSIFYFSFQVDYIYIIFKNAIKRRFVMKILFIFQGPHPVHNAWLRSINPRFMPYIPNFLNKIIFLRDYIYQHTITNQICALMQSIFIPRADIFIVEGFKTILPAIIHKRKNTKIVLINSDQFLLNLETKNFIFKLICHWYIRQVDYFICTSTMMKELTLKYSHAPAFIVYPFADFTKFNNIGDINSSNICSISSARWTGGADIMIDVFKLFNAAYPSSKLFVCDWGEEPYITALKKLKGAVLARSSSIPSNIPSQVLSKSGLYLKCARFDAFGVNILESMAAGIPPVISKFCGAKDLVEQVDPSLVCDLDPQKFADRLVELHRDKKKKIILSNKCKSIASKYTAEHSINSFMQVMKSIITDIKTKQI